MLRELLTTLLPHDALSDERLLSSASSSSSPLLQLLSSAPPALVLAEPVAQLQSLPDSGEPTALELPGAAAGAADDRQSRQLLDTLRQMQPTAGAGGGKEVEEQRALGRAQQLLDSLPADAPWPAAEGGGDGDSGEEAALPSPASPRASSLTVRLLLQREAAALSSLLSVMRASLQSLLRASRGELLPEPSALRLLSASLAAEAVPQLWSAAAARAAGGPLQPFIQRLHRRAAALSDWLQRAEPPALSLADLSRPQSFLAAAMQTAARQAGAGLQSLRWAARVLSEADGAKDEPEAAGARFLIRGLYCEGAAWSAARGVMEDCAATELLSAMPTLQLQAVSDGQDAAASALCSFPVFLSRQRRAGELLLWLPLPSDRPQSHWTLRGAALLCDSD